MHLCPNCRRLDADPASVHNRGRLLLTRTRRVEDGGSIETRTYTCRHCGAVWEMTLTARSPHRPLPAERWSLREAWMPRDPGAPQQPPA